MQKQAPLLPDRDEDFFAWTSHQAKLLRALHGAPVGPLAGLDVASLAEEIEDLGKAELRGVLSLIRQILVHIIKAASAPNALALSHWRTEATNFSLDLPDFYARSMRKSIDMDDLWRRARKAANVALQEHGVALAPNLPAACPFSAEELIGDDFDFDRAVERIVGASR